MEELNVHVMVQPVLLLEVLKADQVREFNMKSRVRPRHLDKLIVKGLVCWACFVDKFRGKEVAAETMVHSKMTVKRRTKSKPVRP